MSKDADGCAKDEHGKGPVEAKRECEIEALLKEAKAQGIDEEFLKKVIAASESTEHTIADLRGLTEKRKPVPKLPPLPRRERELEPHEEQIFLEMLEGEHEAETIVG